MLAETQRIKNIGMTGIHHSLSKTRETIQAWYIPLLFYQKLK